MKFKIMLSSLVVLAVLMVSNIFAANELKLIGEAKEHNFVKVQADIPGKWVVLGPNYLVFHEKFTLEQVAVGTLEPNERESIPTEGGKICVFCGPAGVYAVFHIAIKPAEGGVDADITVSSTAVKIIGDNSPPDDGPVIPPDTPTPLEVPVGEFEVSKPVLQALVAMKGSKIISKGIASNFESVAAKIDAGGYKTGPFDVTYPDGTEGTTNDGIEAIVLDTMNANAQSAGGKDSPEYNKWKEGVFVLIVNKLNALQDTKLKTQADHATCWRELALSFKTYGESK